MKPRGYAITSCKQPRCGGAYRSASPNSRDVTKAEMRAAFQWLCDHVCEEKVGIKVVLPESVRTSVIAPPPPPRVLTPPPPKTGDES